MSTLATRDRRRACAPRRPTPRSVAIVFGLLVASLLLGGTSARAAPPVAVGVRAGTTGLGADITLEMTETMHLRLAGGAYSHDLTINTSDLDYDARVDLRTGLLLLDWHPTGGGFRVSVGGGWNGTQADVSAPAEDLVRHLFPELPAISLDFGTLEGTVKANDLVPVLLVGWGNPFSGGHWKLSFEVGVLYQGKPQVDLHYRNGEDFQIEDIPGGRPFIDSLLAQQERDLEKELEDYTVLPVASFTLSYRF